MSVNVATLSAQTAAEYATKCETEAAAARHAAKVAIEHVAHRKETTTSSVQAYQNAAQNAAKWSVQFPDLPQYSESYVVPAKEWGDLKRIAQRDRNAATLAEWVVKANLDYQYAAEERAAIAEERAAIAENLAADAKRVAENLAAAITK
jgi:hypothetical protein